MNRQRKINCMTFTERKREIERAGEGGEKGEEQIVEGRSKKERRGSEMTMDVCPPNCAARWRLNLSL